jgi:formylglycine-generating enzyme required for sulfatase activity
MRGAKPCPNHNIFNTSTRWSGTLTPRINSTTKRLSAIKRVEIQQNASNFSLQPPAVMEFVWVPAGCFQMGSPPNEEGRYSDEGSVHEVCVDGFWVGKYEVTQAQWQKVIGTNPAYFKGENNPVERVSWDDAQEFITKLNQMAQSVETLHVTSLQYRLPTEAEWEYACRAGTQTAYSFGNNPDRLGEYAWYGKNSGGKTHPVGQLKPNAFGLYDMHGNVWELCEDRYDWNYYANSPPKNPRGSSSGRYRLNRGGGWNSFAGGCRSAFRGNNGPDYRSRDLGFRLVRTP